MSNVSISPLESPNFQAFSRSCTIWIGGVQIQNIGGPQGLRTSFMVRKSLKANESNTCDLSLYNLSDATRKIIEQSAQRAGNAASPPNAFSKATTQTVNVIPVRIDAGYVGHTSTIFLGEMRSAQTVTDGPDDITELNAGEGDAAALIARINKSFPAGSTAMQVVSSLLTQMNVGQGNLASAVSTLSGAPLFQQGAVLKGSASRIMRDVCRSVGLEFSIQRGMAQFLLAGQPLSGSAYLLSSSTGLIGSPSVDTANIMSCVSLMFPGLVPGAPIQVNAKFVQGTYRILSTEITGDTSSLEWYTKIEAAAFGVAP